MNRLDFLHQLYLSLEGIPEPDRRNLLRDFEAHFQLAQQEGKTEEETATALGDPKRVADGLKTHYFASSGYSRFNQAPSPNWAQRDTPQPRRSNRRIVGVMLIAIGLFVLVISILFFPFVFSIRSSSGSRVAMDIREVAADLRYDVDETVSARAEAFDRIEIQVVSDDVEISLEPGEELTAHLKGTVTTTTPTAVPQLVKEEQGTTLVLRVVQQTGSIGFYSSNTTLAISMPESWRGQLAVNSSSADIQLPEADLAALTLHTVSGDIDAGTIVVKEAILLESSSGSVSIDSAISHMFKATTVSGDLFAGNVQAGTLAETSTSSGSTEVLTLTAQTLHVDAISGDIVLEDVSADDIVVSGASSAVDVRNVEGNLEMKTVSGDITLDGLTPNARAHIESSSGSVQAGFPKDLGLKVSVTSSSGSMDGDLSLSDGVRKDHTWTGTRGDGKVELIIQTVSGDVTLD